MAAVLMFAVATSGVVGYLYLSKPAMAPAPDTRAQATPERLARGKYLFNLADCDGCHSPRDFSRFDGPVVEGAAERGACSLRPWDCRAS
jgi:hypothetical protein